MIYRCGASDLSPPWHLASNQALYTSGGGNREGCRAAGVPVAGYDAVEEAQRDR